MSNQHARTLLLLVILPALGLPAPPLRVDLQGDPLPERAIARIGTVRLRHGGTITALAFSPDGKTLASAGEDDRIVLWNVATGKEQRWLETNGQTTSSLSFSRDGKVLQALSSRGEVHRWDVTTGRLFPDLPDGAPREEHETLGTNRKEEAENKLTAILEKDRPSGVTLALTPDERSVVQGEYFGAGLVLWDLEKRQTRVNCNGHTRRVKAAAVSPDGKLLASGGEDHTVRLWDTRTGKERFTFQGPQGGEFACRYLESSKEILLGGEDCRMRFHDPPTGRQLQSWLHRPLGELLAVSPDERIAVFGKSHSRVYLVDLVRQTILHKLVLPAEASGWIQRGAFTPDGGGLLLVASQTISQRRSSSTINRLSLWDVAGGEMIRVLDQTEQQISGPLSVSPDGRMVMLGGTPSGENLSQINTWDLKTGKLLREKKFGAHQACWSPGGQFLVAWDTDLLSQLVLGHGGVQLCEWTGHLAASLPDSSGEATAVGFTKEGRHLAVGLETGDILLRDLALGKEVGRLQGHRGAVRSLSFSRDGRRLVSSSADVTVMIWNVADLLNPKTIVHSEPGREQLRAWWNDLASGDAARAFRAVGGLATAPREAGPFLEEMLRPVRVISEKEVARLLGALDSSRFAVRAAAQRELATMEKTVEYALKRALRGNPSLEKRRRLEQLLAEIEEPERSLERQRAARALLALEYINDKTSRRLLNRLSSGAAGAWLTEQAQAALERQKR